MIVDAENYFRYARSAMQKAQKRIMLIGWDFDSRITLGNPGDGGEQETLGDFVYRLVCENPELEIYLLRWRFGAFKAVFRGTNLITLVKWMWHKQIHTKLDSAHPPGASHHQKIVVIDDGFAFCGGIDMTVDRWDTRKHQDDDEGRTRPDGEKYGPWHDVTSALQGAVAGALAEISRYRWQRAGGKPIEPLGRAIESWPDALPVQFENAAVAIARTEAKVAEHDAVWEIEQLYLDHIKRAQNFIYAENQYFASRRISEAMAERLRDPDGPEIVIVCPKSAEGWLEPLAMDSARNRIFEALSAADKFDRFRIYHPVTRERQPIYVHAKIMIVDDQVLRIGSSNMNNRSLRLDTECDIALDCSLEENSAFTGVISKIRADLLAEHLDVTIDRVLKMQREKNSLIGAIEALRSTGHSLQRFRPEKLSDTEKIVADSEILDPEGPEDSFEPFTNNGLLRGRLKKLLRSNRD